ncbi:GNAT family N-acetyltransferase [Aliikangiella sp. IMCC44359]|uniref:GNAT family N-acetyltransferase n=1 Tax=Aliikangiella sp. IMCC44359 TaxID=3459125 RepID=UPI00403AECEC
MVKLEIKVLTRKDWKTYRELRLQSLQDSPDSFGSTYTSENKYTNEDWVSRLDLKQREILALPLVAELNGTAVGLAWGLARHHNENSAHVYQMWVSPKARGLGVGKLLLEQIINWAKKYRLKAILLSVTTTNFSAIKLYQSAGFQNAGPLEILREGESLMLQPMKLLLNEN